MWCCFNANTVVEPKKINVAPKHLTAEVPVAVKPITLMFRMPSQDEEKETVTVKEKVVVKDTEEHLEGLDAGAQGEEVPSLERDVSNCNTPFTIIYSLSIMALLYLLILETENREL